mgnify:CR=1 FL=1
MSNPLVSILSPCYNVEKYLPQCLDSVINQTYNNLQIVLIDDGSQDNTWGILQEYATKDSRIEIYHQENQGVATARNVLLSKIKGDYFLFVDSDDWIEPIMVEYLLSRVMEYKVEMVTCSKVLNGTDKDKAAKEEFWEQDKLLTEFLRHVNFSGALWNKLFKSSILGDVHFRTDIWYGEDALFTWQLIQKVDKICVSDKQLYNHRINPWSISAQNWTPDKTGSGHLVWKSISNDVTNIYPQYKDVVKARYATEDMWGLYFASICNYPYDEHIIERQQNVKKHFVEIKNAGFLGKGQLLFAWIISRWYGFGCVLRAIRKIEG